MKKTCFYCLVVTTDGRRLWGFHRAPDADLALSCFMQDKGISESEADLNQSFSSLVDSLRVDRMLEYIPEDLDPWGCTPAFEQKLLGDISEAEIAQASSPNERIPDDPRWHAARVLWIARHPENLLDPISVDNQTGYGVVHPIPVILDGWHRFFAHRHLGIEAIFALYGGRVDLLNYLSGRRKTPPKE